MTSFDHVFSTFHPCSTKVGTERQWTTIGCDGLPYILASRIIEKEPKYQHFLLEAGPGHYEINMVRTLFKLLWEVILKDLGYMLGFRSIKAQTSCQKACDHHKSWQMLSIFLEGTVAELLIPYVRQSNMEGKAPSVTGYYQWLSSVKNPNYIFMKNVIFIYVFALFLFRAGIRRNNYEAMAAGRTKFASLFYGLNCTSYQEIEFKELKKIVLSPGPVHEFRAATQSFSCSGDSSRGEGCDFILEAKNKRIQMMMPPGLPTAETWLRICRSLDELCNVSWFASITRNSRNTYNNLFRFPLTLI